MSQFRKKPVVIEAHQWDPTDALTSLPAWLAAYVSANPTLFDELVGAMGIRTLEGTRMAEPGDWIIRGVKGEMYPCKPDIFAATYEPVDASLSTPPASACSQSKEQEPKCATGHTWTNDYGDDWHPDVGMLCDCRQKQWGVPLPEPRKPKLPASAWQPMETAPKNGEQVWLWWDGKRRLAHWHEAVNPPSIGGRFANWLTDDRGSVSAVTKPTLWSPLPPSLEVK